jgi:acyl-coenzyme A thioesterase PaaI-like protein
VIKQQGFLAIDRDRERARLNSACVVCGSANPKGLRISFQQRADLICADWTPTSDWEGFQGVIHGGIITTVLDEAMSKAIIARNWEALTVELKVRFRGRVSAGQAFRIRGWVVEKQRRKILTEATLTSTTGEECAHAWATFLVPLRS